MKQKIEKLRKKLNKVSSTQQKIKLSQELDKLILKYMKEQIS